MRVPKSRMTANYSKNQFAAIAKTAIVRTSKSAVFRNRIL